MQHFLSFWASYSIAWPRCKRSFVSNNWCLVWTGSAFPQSFLSCKQSDAERKDFVDIPEQGPGIHGFYVTQNNWKAVVNVIFRHPACQDFLEEAVRSTISREFKEYCHSNTSVLKYTAPSELASFSNTLVRHEIKTISVVEQCFRRTFRTLGPYKHTAAAKFRNSRMSAFAHRVSVILLRSGGKITTSRD